MFHCETCRSQMLEYLYDLLEGDERQAWEAHLKDCPSCQASLVQAKRQQQLLAAAAKMEFANVRFAAPATSKSARRQGDKETRRRKPEVLSPCLLVALSPCLLPALACRRRDSAGARLPPSLPCCVWPRLSASRANRRPRRQPHRSVPEGSSRSRTAAPSFAAAEGGTYRGHPQGPTDAQLQVKVQGPANIRVGAPTDYQIYTRKSQSAN